VIAMSDLRKRENDKERLPKNEKEEQDQIPDKVLRLVPLASLVIQILEFILKILRIIN
jgi:hypothetical protein